MNRVWDYLGFTVWFAGLGYIVMWLLGSPHHLVLSPGLHGLGVAAALLVPVRLLLRAVGRRPAAPKVPPRTPAAVLRPPRRKSTYPIRQVKPRSHFGLRGVQE
jgi:cytochrome b561